MQQYILSGLSTEHLINVTEVSSFKTLEKSLGPGVGGGYRAAGKTPTFMPRDSIGRRAGILLESYMLDIFAQA